LSHLPVLRTLQRIAIFASASLFIGCGDGPSNQPGELENTEIAKEIAALVINSFEQRSRGFDGTYFFGSDGSTISVCIDGGTISSASTGVLSKPSASDTWRFFYDSCATKNATFLRAESGSITHTILALEGELGSEAGYKVEIGTKGSLQTSYELFAKSPTIIGNMMTTLNVKSNVQQIALLGLEQTYESRTSNSVVALEQNSKDTQGTYFARTSLKTQCVYTSSPILLTFGYIRFETGMCKEISGSVKIDSGSTTLDLKLVNFSEVPTSGGEMPNGGILKLKDQNREMSLEFLPTIRGLTVVITGFNGASFEVPYAELIELAKVPLCRQAC
jgi:hypothetical protein